MRKEYDLTVKIGEYTDNFNKTRARWRNVGSVMINDEGNRFILLDKYFNFDRLDTGERDSYLINMFEPKSSDSYNGGGNSGGGSYSSNTGGNGGGWKRDETPAGFGGDAQIPF